MRNGSRRSGRVIFLALISILWGGPGGFLRALPAGTTLTNRASALHGTSGGGGSTTLSNQSDLILPAVSGLAVSPDDAVPSGVALPGATLLRQFTVTNRANRDDRFRIASLTVTAPATVAGIHFDLDGNGLVDPTDPPVTVGATASPMLSPGAALGVLVSYTAVGVPGGTEIVLGLRAESLEPGSVNGAAEDTGTIRDQVGGGAILSDPANPGQPPAKSVNGQDRIYAVRGEEVAFELALANSGTAGVVDLLVADPLAPGWVYVPGSITLDATPLTDAADGDPGEFVSGAVRVRFPAVAPGESHRIGFRARVDAAVAPGTALSNIADFSATGIPALASSRVEVLVDPYGVAFQAGTGQPVPGLSLALYADSGATTPCPIPVLPGTGLPVNPANSNPTLSDASGRYGFIPDPSVLGPPASTLVCYLRASGSGTLSRLVRVEGTAAAGSTPSSPVYTLTLTPLDSLPLAPAGGIGLVAGPVVVPDVSAIGFNLPVFPQGGLLLVKAADRSHARVGETVGYRVRVLNNGSLPVSSVTLTDLLPDFLDLVEGASRLLDGNGISSLEPDQDGRRLTFPLGTLDPGEQAEISYRARVAPGAPAKAIENSAMVSGTLPGGAIATAGPARAVIFVRQGIFAFDRPLIGRVFEDLDRDGAFNPGDRPLPSVRVVLDNGTTATTDSEGLYSFPAVPAETRSVGLDPETFPPGYCPPVTPRLSDVGGFRLLVTPLRGGSMLKQNFILVSRPGCPERETPAPSPPAPESAATPAGAPAAPGSPPAGPSPDGNPPAGTTVREQIELLPAIEPGGLRIIEPTDGSVALSGALTLTARTHRRGTVRLSVNDHLVSTDLIGVTELDDRNQLATFRFVGIPLLPGPNRVAVDALREDGTAGDHADLTVYGRGVVERITITTSRDTLPADGRSTAVIRVDALDGWDHPAQDIRIRLRATAGRLSGNGTASGDRDVVLSTVDGTAKLNLAAELTTGVADLTAEYGDLSGTGRVRFDPEPGAGLLVGVADATLGAIHSDSGVGDDPASREDGLSGRLALFYRGPAFPGTQLTGAYDSENRLNRTTDSDRLFDLDPLERTYPVMGDSSTRSELAQSNSRLYVKLEKDRSYLLYGDLQPDLGGARLSAYNRKLTGVSLNLENPEGDRIGMSMARPDNAFVREVIPGSGISGLYRLAHTPILPGSEVVSLEIHDRRNPEEILSTLILLRGVDYDFDPLAGTLLFKRPIDTFAGEFDLVQIVVLYEFQTTGLDLLSWNGRGAKGWNGGATRLGVSALGENQEGADDFRIYSTDLTQKLGAGGTLALEVARSDGRPLNFGTAGLGAGTPGSAGTAMRLDLLQPVAALRGPIRLSFSDVDQDFLNPFGATVAPGARRISAGTESALPGRLKLGFLVQTEENRTATVENSRDTGSIKLSGIVNEKVNFTGGFDHRTFDDRISDEQTRSNLVTAGMTLTPVPRWRFSLRREQNVTEDSDPSYPDSTFFSASFRPNPELAYFLKYRDSSKPIEAIADLSVTGLNPPRTQTELQIGAESKLGDFSTLTSRYQVQNGITGTDSFAVVGLGTRLPVREGLAVDFRGEAGLHVDGPGDSFQSFSTGMSWLPRKTFRGTFRYELRNFDGLGQTVTAAAVGKPTDDTTLIARLEASDASQAGEDTTLVGFLGGLALRPLRRDDMGVLVSWEHRDRRQGSAGPGNLVRTLTDTLAADSAFELTARARFFAKAALTFSSESPAEALPEVDTTTTLLQYRLEYRLGERWDVAGEWRDVILWQDTLRRDSLGLEWGIWCTQDLRVGLGYGFTRARPLEGMDDAVRSGFYINFASKLNRVLDLLRSNP